MKKPIITLCLQLLFFSAAMAQPQPTEDYLCINDGNPVELTCGTVTTLTVYLKGSTKYTAYEVYLKLPDGIEMEYNTKGKPIVTMKKPSIYPYTLEDEEDEESEKQYTHTISYSYGETADKTVCVLCTSSDNEELTETSGALFTIKVHATAYAKPGKQSFSFAGSILTTKPSGGKGSQGYYAQEKVTDNVTVSNAMSVAYNISSNDKYGTLVLPFDVAIPMGMKAYTFKSYDEVGGTVRLSGAESFVAYTPYVVYASEGASGTLTGTVDASKYVEVAGVGLLKGAIVEQNKSVGYVLQNKSGNVQFYNMNSQEFTIPSGRCWLELNSDVKSVNMEFEDASTGIIAVDADVDSDRPTCNLSGQVVNDGYKGVIIRNGKKYINR